MKMLPEEYIGICARSRESSDRLYVHTPADVMENYEVELCWDPHKT